MENHRSYLILDKISPGLRALLSVLLIGTGFLFQLSTRNILAGLPFIVACLILNLIKGISIKRIRPGTLKWQEVTPEKIDEVLVQCKKIKKFRSKNMGCIIIAFIFFIFGLSFGVPFLSVITSMSFPLIAAVINAIILFLGLALSGRKSAWMPHALNIKAEIVQRLLTSPIIKKDPMLQAMPYLEIGKTKKGSFPNDTRFLIKFKDAPSEFIGLQGQISINTVKSRAYPYFYVVLIAKHEFKLLEKFGKHSLEKLVIERKKTAEVDVIVIRQRTTKTSGYHTNANVQDYILENSIKFAKDLI